MAIRHTPTHSTRHTIGIQHVDQILIGARARGADVDALLQRAGISAALLDAPLSRVTQDQFAALIFALRHRLRDELWGLCSQPVPTGSFAQATRLLIRCRTLGEALTLGLRHYRLLLSDFVPRLHVQQGEATFALVPRVPPCSHGFDPTMIRSRSSIVPCSITNRPLMYSSPSASRG